MKHIKTENIFAVSALVGVSTLFGSFMITGHGRNSVIFAMFLAAISILTGLIFRAAVEGKGNTKALLRGVLGIVFCAVIVGGSILNTQAAFSFSDTEVLLYLTATATATGGQNSASSVSVSGGVVTVTAKGYTTKNNCGEDVSNQDTVTISIKNNGTATVTYDLTVSGVSDITGGTKLTLKPGASITGTVTSGEGASAAAVTGTLTFSNVSPVSTGANVDTIFANSSQGASGTAWSATVGGTYTVDGTAITGSETLTNVSDHEYALVATPADGYEFYGWMSQSKGILSNSVSYTYKGVEGSSDTIWPIFAKVGEAMYYLKDASPRLYYHTLNEAIAAAGSSDTIVVGRDGILPAGEYTIPSGVTFLVPFDTAGTVYTTTPETLNPENAFTEPECFRTLTMVDGAKITVNGTMSVPAKVIAGNTNANRSACRVSGGYGHVKMENGSSITVNNGGIISVFGYITGEGEVIANSGATVYESFQIADFRGGTATYNLNSQKKVFPFSQYYVQNIEVALTLYSGAKETTYTALYMSDTILPTSITFISDSNAMFSLTSGYMVKKYDKATDRLLIDINGDMTVSSISVEIKYLFDITVDSSKFPLGINGNMTININSGTTTLKQNLAFLPGCELNIAKGATFDTNGQNVFVYDSDEWCGKKYCYYGKEGADLRPLVFVPEREYTRTQADLKDVIIRVAGTLDASSGYLYTTTSGAEIRGVDGGVVKIKSGTTTKTQQYVQVGDEDYDDIDVTPAKLLNANGLTTYTETSVYGAGEYHYFNGTWHLGANCFDKTGDSNHVCDFCKNTAVLNECSGKVATCITAQICDECAKKLKDALGHDIQYETTVDPTCTVGGYDTWKCSRCEEDEQRNLTDPTGHNYEGNEWWVSQEAYCHQPSITCCFCNNCLTDVSIIGESDPTKHESYSTEWIVGDVATCQTEGTRYHPCKKCQQAGNTTETTGKDPHNHTNAQSIENDGGITAVYCSACQEYDNLTGYGTAGYQNETKITPFVGNSITIKVNSVVDSEGKTITLSSAHTMSVVVINEKGQFSRHNEVSYSAGFTMPSLSLLEMNCTVMFTIKNGSEVVASKTITFVEYVDIVCAEGSTATDAQKTLCANTLAFGNALRTYVHMTPTTPAEATINCMTGADVAADYLETNPFGMNLPDQSGKAVTFKTATTYIKENAYPAVYVNKAGFSLDTHKVMGKIDGKWKQLEYLTSTANEYIFVLKDSVNPANNCGEIQYRIVLNSETDVENSTTSVVFTYSLLRYAWSVRNTTNTAYDNVKPVVYAMFNLYQTAKTVGVSE